MNTCILDQAAVTEARAASLADWTDEQLLLEYRASGSESSFAALVARYEHELYGHLRRRLGDASLAEDVFQQTFLNLHLNCEQFEAGRKVRPWLYRIATNQAIDAMRRNRRHRLPSLNQCADPDGDQSSPPIDGLADAEPGPPQRLEEDERRAWTRQALRQLPERLRVAVELVFFQGLTYREAAEALSIPLGTLKSRMHTAFANLNKTWHASQALRTDEL